MRSHQRRRKGSAFVCGALSLVLAASTAVGWGSPSAGAADADFSGFGSAKAVEISVLSGLSPNNNAHPLLDGLLGGAGGLLGGIVSGGGNLLSNLTGGLLGGLLGGGQSNNSSGQPPSGSGSSGSSGQNSGTSGQNSQGLLGLGGTTVEVGVAKASLDSTVQPSARSEAFPLGIQLLGSDETKPLKAQASAPPDSEDNGTLPSVGISGVVAKLLNVRAKAQWEQGYPASEASASTANLGVLGLLNIGVAESGTSVVTDENGAMTTTSHMHLADVSVAGILKINALDVTVTATANGQEGGAKASADDAVARLSILGIPYEIRSGQVLNIPGVVKVALGESEKQEDPNGLYASVSGSGLTIQLLGAVFNGVSLKIGTVSAEAKVPEGGIPFGSPYKLSKVALQDSVEPGGTIEYRLVYNILKDVQGVQIVDTLPEHTKFISADGGGRYDSSKNAVIWDLGDRRKDDGGILTLKVQVDPQTPEGTIIRNTAVISAPQRKPVSSQTVEVTVGPKVHIPFVVGFPDGTFRPNEPVTRAQLASITAHIMKLEDLANQPNPFADVSPEHWARRYIAAVTAKQLFPVFKAGYFEPERWATRAEVASVMVRMHAIAPVEFTKLPGGSQTTFTDVPTSHWAYNDIETAVRLGFLSGYPDGRFGPDEPVTRAQVVALMCRALGRGPLVDGKIPVQRHYPDVAPQDWYFGWVEEASWYGHKGVHVEGRGEALDSYLENVRVW